MNKYLEDGFIKSRVNIFSTSRFLIDDHSVLQNRWSTMKFWLISNTSRNTYWYLFYSDGQWIHENPAAVVNPGDTVNYWVYEIVNGLPQQVLNQAWTAGKNKYIYV